jgi:multiple sugar transport system ATP-binding protein
LARVAVRNLKKMFGKVVAVNNLSFETEDQEFLALLGPSGCGKTTTLRCIAGLETPDEGEVYIGDTLVNDIPPRERDIAMVFQSYALYPHMTVFDNLAFPLKMRKVSKDEIRAKVRHTADFLRIGHLLNRKPGQLSGGEAQRVALGRAIIREPKVFLMDEPLSNLDAKLRVYMRAELKKMQKELKITTIYVTHDQLEAMTMADRIAIMNQGILQQLATPEEAYNNPQNLFVAGFIGSPPMNFIDVNFSEKNGKCFIDATTFELQIPDVVGDVIKQKARGSELILGVRPEDILVRRKPFSGVNIEAEVYVVEPLGSEILLNLKVGENFVNAKVPQGFMAKTNTIDKVWISFDVSKIHIFDKKTEKAIRNIRNNIR